MIRLYLKYSNTHECKTIWLIPKYLVSASSTWNCQQQHQHHGTIIWLWSYHVELSRNGAVIRDFKQPRRRAEWTPTGSVLTKSSTSAHVSYVVHIAFRTWHLLICRPQVNVSISNLWRFCAHFTMFNTNVLKKETFFVLFVEGWAVGGKTSRDFR